MASRVVTVNDILDGHVGLNLECFDRIYLNGWVPNLQRICDSLGPGTIRVFCERWWARLPLPLTEADRAASYWWDISLRQVEVSRTIVFDPRVMALAGALCALVHTITGFTNRSLCVQVSTLLGVPYSMSQMSYDLRRLRLKGLITRLPHTNTYVLTEKGQRVATFYTKLHNRLLRPLLAAHDPPAPLALRQALRVINHHVDDYISEARMTA